MENHEEKSYLERLGLDKSVKDLSPGQLEYLLNRGEVRNYASEIGPVVANTVFKHGYEWRNNLDYRFKQLKDLSPQARIYLDALVRLDELYGAKRTERGEYATDNYHTEMDIAHGGND